MHLPIGVSDFKALIEYRNPFTNESYVYVDKSLFIKEIIGDGTPVMVLTRPRRFGKTLNLSMLRYFFAAKIKNSATAKLFEDLAIAKEVKCMEYQGQYPVIFISFKDAKYKTYDLCYEHIKDQIIDCYIEYSFLIESDKLTETEKNLFKDYLDRKIDRIHVDKSLKQLTSFIEKVTGKQAIILIDEYDTPIQEAYLHGYYEDLTAFIRNLLSSSLKDNSSLKRAILTGILRISKESLFSGLSNVKIYSVFNKKYAEHFGFTGQEVQTLLAKTQLSINLEKAKEWYNGYNFGGTTIYNPWSIIEFINEEGKLRSYWVNTSGNELVKNLIINSSNNIQESMKGLLAGDTIKQYVDEHIIFNDLNTSPSAIWSLLLMSGYLKCISYTDQGRRYLCELTIPNNEVADFYASVIDSIKVVAETT